MSLSKKSFSLFKRDAFLFFANTLTSVVIARKLGPEVMGVWILLSLIPIYAETFGRLKFDIASVYFLGKAIYAEKDVERTLNSVAIIVSLIITSIIILFFFRKNIATLIYDVKQIDVNLKAVNKNIIKVNENVVYMSPTIDTINDKQDFIISKQYELIDSIAKNNELIRNNNNLVKKQTDAIISLQNRIIDSLNKKNIN